MNFCQKCNNLSNNKDCFCSGAFITKSSDKSIDELITCNCCNECRKECILSMLKELEMKKSNNFIFKKYVSFEVAKLLNLCKIDCLDFFEQVDNYVADYYYNKNSKEFREYDFIIKDDPDDWYYATEFWQILDWLDKNIKFFDLWIEPVLSENPKQYRWKIWHRGEFIESNPFSDKDIALNKGIEYALNQFIGYEN